MFKVRPPERGVRFRQYQEEFSPDYRYTAYVDDYNLYLRDLGKGRDGRLEPVAARSPGRPAVLAASSLVSSAVFHVDDGRQPRLRGPENTFMHACRKDTNAEPGRAAEAATNRSGTQRASTDRLQFRRLKNTRAEVKSVRASFLAAFPEAKVELFKGKDATEQHVREAVRGRRYVHLATHGFFAPQELSALQQASRPGPTAGWLERPAGKGLFDRRVSSASTRGC